MNLLGERGAPRLKELNGPFNPLADARRLSYGPHMWLSRDGHGAVVTGFNE